MGSQTLQDDYRHTALSGLWEEAEAAFCTLSSEHQRQSWNIIEKSIYRTLPQFPPYYIAVTLRFMPRSRLTQFKYALKRKVEWDGDFIFTLEAKCLTHISQVVLLYTHYEGIHYLVYRCLSTRLVPLKGFSKEHLFPGVEWYMNITETSTLGGAFQMFLRYFGTGLYC